MFIPSTTCYGWEFGSVNHTSINENSELNVFRKQKFDGDISNNCGNDLFGLNVLKTSGLCWYVLFTRLQCTNISSVIFKLGPFSPFLSFVIFFLVLPVNFMVSGDKISRQYSYLILNETFSLMLFT